MTETIIIQKPEPEPTNQVQPEIIQQAQQLGQTMEQVEQLQGTADQVNETIQQLQTQLEIQQAEITSLNNRIYEQNQTSEPEPQIEEDIEIIQPPEPEPEVEPEPMETTKETFLHKAVNWMLS